MRRFLLDTSPLAGNLTGRSGAIATIDPWLDESEAETSILVYGEVVEHIAGRPDFSRRRSELRRLLHAIRPNPLSQPIMERYAALRRQLRPPHGPGLIGDIDTLIAATAMEHDLTLVTTDRDFVRVPGLRLMLLDRRSFAEIDRGTTTA